MLFLLIPLVNSTVYVPTTTYFGSSNAYFNFSTPQTFSTIEKQYDFWYFNGKGIFTNVNLTLTNWIIGNWINYTVVDVGSQWFYWFNEPTQVFIDNILKSKGDGWVYLAGSIIIDVATLSVQINFGSVPIPPPPPPPPYINETFYYEPMPNDSSLMSSGNFKLQLFKNGSVGVQENINYVKIKLISDYELDCYGSINQYRGSGTFTFISNTNGTIEIESDDISLIQVFVNGSTRVLTDNTFNFNDDDIVNIYWSNWNLQENPYLSKWINAYFGIAGLIIIGVSPLISYYIGYKKSKYGIFAFSFVEIGILVLGLGLLLGFIYA